jgi:cellulose synthase operon protein C
MLARLILACALTAGAAAAPGVTYGGDAAPSVAGNEPFVQAEPRAQAVDESALRYYAALKQVPRVEAEMRRLRRLHPDWSPPADLWTARPSDADEGALWDLFAADRLEDLRKAIDERRAAHPDWTPSTDLARKLERKEMRAKIVAGRQTESWIDVAAIADRGHFADDTSDVGVLWDIADAYARTKRPADALRILTSILKTRSDANERVGTIHRAIASLPMADVERLLSMGRPDAAGIGEFEAITTDVTRARMSAFLHDEPAREITAAELIRFGDFARTTSDPNQPALIAWYALKRNDLREALEWFKQAIDRGGDATVAHGLALTLQRLGQLREAEEVAYAWREPLPANAILFIDVLADQLTRPGPLAIDETRILRYAAVTQQTASGEGAQALAWYAYNSCQFNVALEWFRRAVAWFPKEGSVFGYALTLRRLKRNQEFVEVVNRYDGLFPKVLTLLFPENAAPSDMACERRGADNRLARADKFLRLHAADHQQAAPPPSALDASAAGIRVDLPPRFRRPSIPMPQTRVASADGSVLLVKRSDFPIAVLPENPLRFAPSGRNWGPARSAAGEWRTAENFAPVTMARRVPGVGPMPYERFGLKLARAWNGIDWPSDASGTELRAAVGTLWHLEYAASGNRAQALRPAESRQGAIADKSSEADSASRFHR